MKRFAAVIAALAGMFAASGAFGNVQTFERFSVDVPEGWSARQEGPMVLLTKNDCSASMSITVADPQGMNKKALAQAFMRELKGTSLERDSDGDYTFDIMNAGGEKSEAYLGGDDDDYILFVITGMKNARDEITHILGTIMDN